MSALIAQRSAKAAEVEKAAAELASLDAEIRVEAAKLAGVPEAHPETANGVVHTVGPNGSNGASGYAVPSVAEIAPTSAPQVATVRGQLAPRKVDLLKLLLEKPEASLAHLAIRLYGNEGRTSRANVSEYCADLEARGYVQPGSRPETFRLTDKGRAMCQ